MIRQDTDFGRDIGDGVKDQLKAEQPDSLVGETLHKPTDTDFSAPVARLHDANCDLVVIGGIVRDTVQIISAIRKTGWNVDLLGQAASYDEAVATVPGGAHGRLLLDDADAVRHRKLQRPEGEGVRAGVSRSCTASRRTLPPRSAIPAPKWRCRR